MTAGWLDDKFLDPAFGLRFWNQKKIISFFCKSRSSLFCELMGGATRIDAGLAPLLSLDCSPVIGVTLVSKIRTLGPRIVSFLRADSLSPRFRMSSSTLCLTVSRGRRADSQRCVSFTLSVSCDAMLSMLCAKASEAVTRSRVCGFFR